MNIIQRNLSREIKLKKVLRDWKYFLNLISSQCSHFTPLENIRKYLLSRCFLRDKIVARNGSTHFSQALHFIQKPFVCFSEQNKWLVSVWNATMGWNGLITWGSFASCIPSKILTLLCLVSHKRSYILKQPAAFSC